MQIIPLDANVMEVRLEDGTLFRMTDTKGKLYIRLMAGDLNVVRENDKTVSLMGDDACWDMLKKFLKER